MELCQPFEKRTTEFQDEMVKRHGWRDWSERSNG